VEQAGDEGGLRQHVVTVDVVNLPLPDHRHRLVNGQRSACRTQATEAKPSRSKCPLPRCFDRSPNDLGGRDLADSGLAALEAEIAETCRS
jgi:hypothetical protein